MNNACTPGPWELEEVVNDSGNIKHLVPVACIDGELTSLLTTVEHNGVNFATVYDDADARLMVEAPALLKSLKDLLAAVNVRIDDPRIALFDAARALVATVDPDAPLSSAWCASVDAELAATADADAVRSSSVLGAKFEPCMDIYAQPGTQVRFRAGGGYDWEKESAKKAGFVRNQIYTVKRCDIGHSKTYVLFDEISDRWNSCLFADISIPHVGASNAPTLPAAAVAEGAQLDGESLEQAS